MKARTTYEIVGCGSSHIYRAYNNSVNAMERAIKERLLYYKMEDGSYKETPLPHQSAFTTDAQEFLSKIKKLATYCHPLALDSFVECFHGPKKERYRKAAYNLTHGTYNSNLKGHLKYFLKYETYNLTLKPNAKPRGINPRSDEFIVDYGRRIKPIEKLIYNDINTVLGYQIIFKGLNQATRGALFAEYWSCFRHPVAIAIDASAFEASVSKSSLEFSHSIYNFYIRNDNEFMRMQKMQINNKGTGYAPDGKVKFCTTGKRASGDPDTALGNCLITAYMFYQFMKILAIVKHRGAIDGDDGVIIIEREDLFKVIEYGKEFYLKYGFRMVFENPVFELEKISFCQSQPVWTEDGYVMVRNPRSATAKDAISRKNLRDKKSYLRWISSIGQCGISCTGGIPVMQEYYSMYVRNSCGAKSFEKEKLLDDYTNYKVQGMTRKYKEVHPRSRFSFYLAFDITPDEQEVVENYYRDLVLEHGLQEEDLSVTPELPLTA